MNEFEAAVKKLIDEKDFTKRLDLMIDGLVIARRVINDRDSEIVRLKRGDFAEPIGDVISREKVDEVLSDYDNRMLELANAVDARDRRIRELEAALKEASR